MTKGHHYIEAIDLLLDSELHRLQQERDELIASRISHLVEKFGISPHSRRLAGAFRSTKTSNKDETLDRRVLVFRERFPELRLLGDAELKELINSLNELMSPIDVDLYGERTKLSTVSTVIRPLSTKWLERWKSLRPNDFNYEQAVLRANELLETELGDLEAAETWLQKVYDLFADLVVFRPNRNENSPVAERRPVGMVSESNERIYRRNWVEFRSRLLKDIQKNADELASGNRTSAYNSSYRRTIETGYSDNYQAQANRNQPEYASVGAMPVATAGYSVTIESANTSAASATKKWSNKVQLEQELDSWLRKIAAVWGDAGLMIHVTLEVTGTSDDSVIKIPNKSQSEASSAIKTLLE
jgi:hypothetical protein